MLWFKHKSTARRDEFLMELRFKYGSDGYTAWFITLELMAEQGVKQTSPGKWIARLKASPRWFAEECGLPPDRLESIYKLAASRGKFKFRYSKAHWIIEWPKVLAYKDEYTEKLMAKSRDGVPSESGQSPARPEPEPEPEPDKRNQTKRGPVAGQVSHSPGENGQLAEARRVIAVLEDEAARTKALQLLALWEADAEIPKRKLAEMARGLCNLRETLVHEPPNFPADNVFRYALDEAVRHGGKSIEYLQTVVRNAITKVRDGMQLV